jgi:Leucine Rich repeats (2 copies)/NACHT domain
MESSFYGKADAELSDPASNWRQKIPFIIRLRNCNDGQLPRPSQLPLLLAKELPDPPINWIDDILRGGRGLIMFDGVDEVPPQVRNIMMQEIRDFITIYPENYYIVTTRPEAVEREEFIERGFISARVESMTVSDRNEFIDRWHEAMEVRLRNWNEPENLRPLAKRLKQRLEVTPAVSLLTSNPLLCAVVCALHRLRNENLPETPVDLCEKLCEMLLDRRDKERLGVEFQRQIDETYGRLEFRVRKGLLSHLAYHMVTSGMSAITEAEADEQITEALKNYPFVYGITAKVVRQVIVERSGMLQESIEQKIEFIHNTLKEFLAAERFVNVGDFQILADHANEVSWQPVILFAIALPRDGSEFATNLVRAILRKTPLDTPSKGRSKKDKAKAASVRSQQFFLFRCHVNAYQINDPDIKNSFNQLSEQLLPPRNIADALALASCGDAIVPYLKNRRGLKASERAACVRTLGLIGNPQATTLLEEYLRDSTLLVAQELVKVVHDWSRISLIENQVKVHGHIPVAIPSKFRDPSSLKNLTSLTDLHLGGTQVNDISALANLTSLTYLYLGGTQVNDISALANLTSLTDLHLGGTQVNDISALANLKSLTNLNLRRTQVNDISALANLKSLTELHLQWTQVNDISALANLKSLTNLNLRRTQVNDISALANLKSLTDLDLSETQVNDISALANLKSLTDLYLSETQVNDISVLSNLTNLKIRQ